MKKVNRENKETEKSEYSLEVILENRISQNEEQRKKIEEEIKNK